MADRVGDTTSNRGFVSLDRETHKRIARKGGEHSHGGPSSAGRSGRD